MKACTVTKWMMVVIASATLPAGASAQDATSVSGPSPAVQVTPFVSIDSSGATPIGAGISFPLSRSFRLETEVDYRHEAGLNALGSSANLLYALPRIGQTTPYLAAGAGLAQGGAPIVSPDGLVGTQPTIRFEVNAGGGLLVPVDDSWGMRTDARWFKSFGRNGGEHWRVSQGVSFDVRKR